MRGEPPSIRFEGVTRRYGATPALQSIDLEISAGSFVALVGASGSGKSTLLRTVNRLDEASGVERSGRVLIDGRAVEDEPAPQLRRRIGYVFQQVGLLPHMTVAANVTIGLRLTGVREHASRVEAMLDLVELPREMAARMPAELSGGQRQRVGIARALAPAPRLLLMDEPLGALDAITREALGQRLRVLHGELGLTTVMVTHDMAEALLLSDRVLVMEAGRIVADTTPAALLRGEGGAAAQALVAVPRAQAVRIAAMAGPGAEAGGA